MEAPRIGVVGSTGSLRAAGREVPTLYVNARYVEAVVAAGGLPLVLPPVAEPELAEAMLVACDALLFCGGQDLDPGLYGEEAGLKTDAANRGLDRFQLDLFHAGRKSGLPILGICRGMQLINVAMGGSLHQDIGTELDSALGHRQTGARDETSHEVELEPGSLAATFLGGTSIRTNSLHHQCVKRLGLGLRVSARAADDVIEAIEATDGSCLLGVQWHPEELFAARPEALGLFKTFVGKAGLAAKAR